LNLHLGKRILVTGGASFLDSHLSDRVQAFSGQDIMEFGNGDQFHVDDLIKGMVGGAPAAKT
jgi:nucleoside-diphosphate-sugar epimerase